MRKMLLVGIALMLVSCSDPKDTTLPALKDMGSIQSQIEKLSAEERELLTSYIAGKAIGSAFGGKGPEGVTIRQALEEQRKYAAETKEKNEAEKALRAKLQAEREAALKKMREAVTVTLVNKKLEVERGFSGIVTDENLVVLFGYKNNSDKDISGVKGRIIVQDVFGDELSAFQISNDDGIKAGGVKTWRGSRSVRYSLGNNKDRKLAELENNKYKVVWEPQAIIFADGTTLKTPD